MTTVTAAGVRLCNAVELVDAGADAIQVELCESCGCSGCAPGGWVSLRRLGDDVLWIPAWEEMSRGGWEEDHYRPPGFIGSVGVPVFSPATWGQMRELHDGLATVSAVAPLTSREAIRLVQHTAPARALGAFPSSPRLSWVGFGRLDDRACLLLDGVCVLVSDAG